MEMKNGRLCWGLLSTARINERLIPVLRESAHSELLAVASRSREAAQAYASRRQIPRAYGSYDELLADPEIDVVYLALPNHLHSEWSVKCADARKHVLCEKPLALTVEEVDLMTAASKRNRVIIQEAAMMRFHPQMRQLSEAVAQKIIGEVRLIRGVFTFTLRRPGDVRFNPAMGGGSLWDVGSYCVSFARTALQAEPVEVFGSQSTRDGVDVNFSGQMRFSSGVLVHFFSSFDSFPHVEADLLGTEGRLYLDLPWVNQPGKTGRLRLTRLRSQGEKSTFGDGLQQETTDWKTYEDMNGYRDEVDSMAESVLKGAAPVVSLADSRNNVAAINALARSAQEGRPVML
jgi:predicted dehydrogenase